MRISSQVLGHSCLSRITWAARESLHLHTQLGERESQSTPSARYERACIDKSTLYEMRARESSLIQSAVRGEHDQTYLYNKSNFPGYLLPHEHETTTSTKQARASRDGYLSSPDHISNIDTAVVFEHAAAIEQVSSRGEHIYACTSCLVIRS